jgi:acyl-CoA synthetase (AMP-forming)/AMP-acid ligase II
VRLCAQSKVRHPGVTAPREGQNSRKSNDTDNSQRWATISGSVAIQARFDQTAFKSDAAAAAETIDPPKVERRPIMPEPSPLPASLESRDTWKLNAGMWAARKMQNVFNDVTVDASGIDRRLADGPIRGAVCLMLGHTGFDDPGRAVAYTWDKLRLIPAVTERVRYAPFMKLAMNAVDALSVPDTTNPAGAQAEIDVLVRQMADLIEQGHNIGWYPAGEIMKLLTKGEERVWEERIDGHQLLGLLLAELERRGVPPPPMLTLTQKGGNGTAFTRAGNGDQRPELGAGIHEHAGGVLENIFKHPFKTLRHGFVKEKRPIHFAIEDATDALLGKSVAEQNAYLSARSNAPDPRSKDGAAYPAWYVPIRHADPRGFGITEPPPAKASDRKVTLSAEERAERADTVRAHLARLAGVPVSEITDQTRLTDLGMSSVQIAIHLLQWINKEFHRAFGSVDAFGLRPTVGDVIRGACGEIDDTAGLEFSPVSKAWEDLRVGGVRAELPKGAKGVADAFLKMARLQPDRIACFDEILGETTFRTLAGLASMLVESIEKIPGERVGMLFPNSVLGSATYLACLFAGKTPVMVNPQWTDEQAKSAMKDAEVQKIITPMQVVRALKGKRIADDEEAMKAGTKTADEVANDPTETIYPSIEDRFWLIDNEVRKLSELELAKTKKAVSSILETRVGRHTLARFIGPSHLESLERRLDKVPEDVVVLFTSGSTGMPKGVAYTDRQVLETAQALADRLEVRTDDVLIQFAPAFHLVGYTSGLVSLLMGVPAANVPDPRAAAYASRMTQLRGGTVLVGTPSLLDAVAGVAEENGLPTVKRILWGAERLKLDQAARISGACPNAQLLAGYGATEQNVTIVQKFALTDDHRKQLEAMDVDWTRVLGEVLEGVDHHIVDLETRSKPLPKGEMGVFVARGLGVMDAERGYLKIGPKKGSFAEVEGKKYYDSEDLMRVVTLEGPQGAADLLVFCGRLGRFSKIGGEMIGHEAIENVLQPLLPPADNGYNALVVQGATEDAPPIAYITSDRGIDGQPLTARGIHAALMKAFQSNPNYALGDVRVVDRIEALGAGKVNLGKYSAMAKHPHDGVTLPRGPVASAA